jgi:hypothetical protein
MKLFTTISLAAMTLFAGAVLAAAPAGPPELKVPVVKGAAPKIDGVLDDAIWAKAAVAAEFKTADGTAAKSKTRVLVARDDATLYVAIECFDSEKGLKELTAKVTDHDGDGIWEDDDVEIFLDPTDQRQTYYQVLVNPKGTTLDLFCRADKAKDLRWDPKYEVAAKVGKENWVVELAIPLAAFDQSERFNRWGFNAARHVAATSEYTYWSPVYGKSAHVPERFGTLVGMPGKAPPERTTPLPPPPPPKLEDVVLFGFQDAAAAKAWSALDLPDEKKKEPPAKVEPGEGGKGLKITFAGGTWPAVTTSAIPEADWKGWQTLKADVTVARPCVVGLRMLQEKSQRGYGWDELVSRWEKTEFLQAGKNTIVAPLRSRDESLLPAARGKITTVEIYMYEPHAGESITVEGVRLSADPIPPGPKVQFKVLGTDLAVAGVGELAERMKPKWTPPQARTLDAIEADFRAKYEDLKKAHPKAVLAVLRDGEKGFDPANPDKVYDGWRDAHVNSHGPDGSLEGRAAKTGRQEWSELFMRHRSRLMRVDLRSIPKGSTILAATLVLTRAGPIEAKDDPAKKPTMWVAEACNRPWDEYEVNAYQYAKEKYWKAIGGQFYGDDPDFMPLYLAYGPSQGLVNTWDFTEAVRWWTDESHENFGFFWHTTPDDYWPGASPTRESKNVKSRPAVMVIYEPQ